MRFESLAKGGKVAGVLAMMLSTAVTAHAQVGSLGANAPQLFQQRCGSCHSDGMRPAPNANAGAKPAPPLEDLRARQTPEAVYRIIDDVGLMAMHARGWSADDKRKVAEFVTGKTMAVAEVLAPGQGQCSETGLVYSLDTRTGCFYWTFAAAAPVRTAIVLGESPRAESGTLLYFGDLKANVYAIDARSGTLVWKEQIDQHPLARITGSPALADGRLYVPVSGVGEEAQAGNPMYECCTFRGSVASLDAHRGTVFWKSYTIPETPAPREKNARGVQLYGPAGASIWSAPTVDLERGALYVGTGNGFTRPAADTTDAVLAFALKDGRLLWKNQLYAGDAGGLNEDFDIGASLVLRKIAGGKRVLVVGQKSGNVFGLDPDRDGVQLWKVRVGKGDLWGGIEWGMAADDRFVYVAVSDYPMINTNKPPTPEAGSLVALELATGEQSWMQKAAVTCDKVADCHPAKSAALTAIPGVVFAGSLDGYLRAHATADGRRLADGRQLWEYNTAVEFTTVNGVKGKGGSINGPGPAVAGGMVFVNSGYSFFAKGGNVLLAFAVE